MVSAAMCQLDVASGVRVYPPRQRWVPDATAYRERRRTPEDARSNAYHLVRGGSLMLRPAGRVGEGTQPASGGSGLGSSINDPPLTRWVCARLGTQPASGGSGVGSSIKDPPLTRWVCAKSDALPSDSTARCGAKRPGESSRLRVFVAKSCPSLILDIAAR